MSRKPKKTESETENEHWMNSKWRPMMGWMYMAVCACDFMLFPILWSLLQSLSHGTVQTQWQPLTLQGAGLFHVAMGAVLGIAAYGRTQEKLGGANNGGIQLPPNAGTTYIPPGQGTVNVSNQPNTSFGGNAYGTPAGFSGGGGSPTPGYGAAPAGYGGIQLPPNAGTTYIPPGQGTVNVSNQPGMNQGFGSTNSSFGNNSGFGSTAPVTNSFGPQPVAAPITTGYQGKKAPPDPVFPSI